MSELPGRVFQTRILREDSRGFAYQIEHGMISHTPLMMIRQSRFIRGISIVTR